MTNDRADTWRLWKGPATIWLALVLLFAISLGSAYLPLGPGNIALNLTIAAAMVALLAIFLMDLLNAKILLRIAAVAGLFWVTLMFALTFSDYFSRYY
jgi:cytochrome c oxidase subunit IV